MVVRTASISGACVALVDALNKMVEEGKLKRALLNQWSLRYL